MSEKLSSDQENAKKYLDSITAEGSEITINIKILDSEKAIELMSTMYDRNIEKFGVAVQSWGFWNIQKANTLRVEAMKAEVDRHQQEMQDLMYKHDQDYLKTDETDQ